jgi:hypothetical protein
MDTVRMFRSQAAYDAYLEQERQARLARLVEERKAILAREKALGPARLPERQMPSADVTCQRMLDILSRKDVEQQSAYSRRFARSVRLFAGGAPGLGHR